MTAQMESDSEEHQHAQVCHTHLSPQAMRSFSSKMSTRSSCYKVPVWQVVDAHLQGHFPSGQSLPTACSELEGLNYNIQPRASVMLQYACLMEILAKVCPTGLLAQSTMHSSLDTLSRLDPGLVPGRKSTTIAWLAAGLRSSTGLVPQSQRRHGS